MMGRPAAFLPVFAPSLPTVWMTGNAQEFALNKSRSLPFSEWGRIVTDEQLAAAIIDRIVHYGHFIDCGKKDWRIATSPMNNQTFVEKKEAKK